MALRQKSAAWPLALLYAALIVHASLFPFTGWRDQGIVPWSYLQAPWPRYSTTFDLMTNVVGYVPFGFLLALALQRTRLRAPAVLLASVAATLLSFVMESLQSYLPQRFASNVDFALNAAGGFVGALLAALLERLGALDRWQQVRARWFAPDARGALVLLALWPVGLLFPPPVAFGLGQVYERAEEGLARLLEDTPLLEWLPLREIDLQPLLPVAETACVALGALVPVVLGYSVITQRRRRAVFALMALAVGVGISTLSTALSFGPVHAFAWATPPVRLGLPIAAAAAICLLPVAPRACLAALLPILAGQLALLNSAPESAYYAITLQGWEQGRFIHFFGLAQWVGWLWPWVTALWLMMRLPGTARKRTNA